MRFVIKLDSGKFVARSHGRTPLMCEDQQSAEIWVDQKAAVAWCMERGFGANVIPIDIPVAEMVSAKPKAEKVEKKEDKASEAK